MCASAPSTYATCQLSQVMWFLPTAMDGKGMIEDQWGSTYVEYLVVKIGGLFWLGWRQLYAGYDKIKGNSA